MKPETAGELLINVIEVIIPHGIYDIITFETNAFSERTGELIDSTRFETERDAYDHAYALLDNWELRH